jgi:hypothetical protein
MDPTASRFRSRTPTSTSATRSTARSRNSVSAEIRPYAERQEESLRAAGARGGLARVAAGRRGAPFLRRDSHGPRSGRARVVDGFGLAHEAPNLGILGTSADPSSGGHNPTLTLQARARAPAARTRCVKVRAPGPLRGGLGGGLRLRRCVRRERERGRRRNREDERRCAALALHGDPSGGCSMGGVRSPYRTGLSGRDPPFTTPSGAPCGRRAAAPLRRQGDRYEVFCGQTPTCSLVAVRS